MKRAALLLGSLLMVGAMAQAEDTVVATPLVDQQVTAFKPTGYVDLQYRIYGKTENAENGTNDWNAGKNDTSRLQLQGSITMTPNQSLEYRVREFNSLNKEGINGNDNETRLRYFYKHGNLGDTKVSLTSRVQYYNKEGKDSQSLQYMPRFSFKSYMPANVTKFVVAPFYEYEWNNSNDNTYDNKLGVNLETYTQLPYNFGFEFEVDTTQNFYGKDQLFDNGKNKKDHNFDVNIKAILSRDIVLYAQDKTDVKLHFEGGLDTYDMSQYRKYGEATKEINGKKTNYKGIDKAQYVAYAEPSIQLGYSLNDSTVLYAAIGAKYKNWDNKADTSASTWRWQPEAWAGFKTSF